MARDIVSIGEFASGPEAGLAQSLLEEEGIEAFVAGESAQAWAFGAGQWTQGVRLQVLAKDAKRAAAVLGKVEGRIRDRVEREYREGVAAEGDVPIESRGDAMARRARTSAVFSIVIGPAILLAIVFLLLSSTPRAVSSLTAQGRAWQWQALLFSLVVGGVWGLVLWQVL